MSLNSKTFQKQLDVLNAKQNKMVDLQPKEVIQYEYQQDMESLDQLAFAAKYGASSLNDYQLNAFSKVAGGLTSKIQDHNTNLLQDIGTGAAISLGDNVPKLASGLGYLATAPSDGSSTPLSDWFKEGIEGQEAEANASRQGYSRATQKSESVRAAAAKLRGEAFDQIADPSVGDYVGDFVEATGEYLSNPRSIAPLAAESADSLITMPIGGALAGGIAKAAIKHKIKGLTADVAAKMLTKASVKGASVFGVGYTGVSEGGHNAIGALLDIEGMSHEDLSKSPEYTKLLNDNPNMSPEEAKTSLALDIAKETGLKSGALAALIGKATGASDLFSKALLKGADKKVAGKVAKRLVGTKKVLKGAATEGVEEILQSGSGQAIANVASQKADPDRKVMQGVTDAAAGGMLAGAATGGTIAAVSEVSKGSTKAAVQGVGKVSKVIQEKAAAVKEVDSSKKWEGIETKDISTEVDRAIEAKDGKTLANAMMTILERKGTEKNPEVVAKYDTDLAKIQEFANTKKVDQEKKTETEVAKIQASTKELTKDQVTTAVTAIVENPDAPYSADLSKKISGSKKLTTKQKVLIKESRKKDSVLSKVLRKSQDDVADDIYWGGEGFAGLTEYTQVITQAIKDNDLNTAHRAIRNLGRLAGSHAAKVKSGKTHQGVEIGTDLLSRITDESDAIHIVHAGLRDTAIAAFPKFAEAEARGKEQLSMVEKVKGIRSKATTGTTLSDTKRVGIVSEALGSLLSVSTDAADGSVSEFRKALATKGKLGEEALQELSKDLDNFKYLSAKKKLSQEEKDSLRASKKAVLKAYDTLTASDTVGSGKLQSALQTQAGDRDISGLFVVGETDPVLKLEMVTLTDDIATKVKEIAAATKAGDKSGAKILNDEKTTLISQKSALQDQINKVERGEVPLTTPAKKRGHTPEPNIKIDTPEHRTRYAELYAMVKAEGTLNEEQEQTLDLLPESFNDFTENVVDKYTSLVSLINEIELVNSEVNAATNDTKANSTTPHNRTLKNALERLPLFSLVRKAFNFVQPQSLGLFHTEADVFGKLSEEGSIKDHLTANMSEGTKQDATTLAKFVVKVTSALQGSMIAPADRDGRNFINTPFEDFVDSKGNLDPTIADAVAVGLADWIHTKGIKSATNNTDETIAHNLGMSGEAARRYEPTSNEKKELRRAGVNRNGFINSVGSTIYKNLGYKLKTDSNDAQRHIEETLINNLGTLALIASEQFGTKGLTETNYIHRFEVTNDYGTKRIVILTDSPTPPNELRGQYGIPSNVKRQGSATPVIRATKNKNQVEGERTRLTSAAEDALQSMGNIPLTRDILGLSTTEEPVYMDNESMPKSEDYQPYASPTENTAIDNQNSIKHIPNDELYDFVMSLTPEQQITLLDDLPDEGNEHMDNAKRNKDVRASLLLQYEGAKNIRERMQNEASRTVRFINNLAKSNRRITQGGMDGTPVGSKLVRELFIPQEQEVTIDPSNPVHMLAFKVAVLHGLDDKTSVLDDQGNPIAMKKGIDKSVDAAVEAAWENLLKDKTLVEAAKALGSGSSPETVFAALPRKGIKRGAGDSYMHRLHALQALAQYQKAQGQPFKTMLGKEDDGIVNGTANLRMQALGANSIDEWLAEMEKVGVYLNEEGRPTSFAEFTKEASNLDPYEAQSADMKEALTNPENAPFSEHSVLPTVGSNSALFSKPITWLNKQWKSKITVKDTDGNTTQIRRLYKNDNMSDPSISQTLEEHQAMSKAINFIINFTPEARIEDEMLEISRDFSKDPLMQYNYQASLKGLKVALSSKIEGAIRIALEQINLLDDKTDAIAMLEQSVNDLNFMDQDTWDVEKAAFDRTTPWKFKVSENPLETPIDRAVSENIAVAIEFTYGPALDYAFQKNYSTLRDNMGHVVNMTRIATAVYSSMYAAKEQAILKETGQISLSVQQEKQIKDELKEHSPAVAHAFSKDRTKDGIVVGEKENTINRDEKGDFINAAANEVKMDYKVKGVKKKKTSITSATSSPQMQDPSVSAAAVFTHGVDSAHQKTDMVRGTSFTNVHDAKILSILDSMASTERTNKDFIEVHKDFSFIDSALDMLREMLKSGDATTEIIDAAFAEVQRHNGSLTNFDDALTYMEFLEEFNAQTQHNRKEAFSLGLNVHQFFNSDGSVHKSEGAKSLEDVRKSWKGSTQEQATEAAPTYHKPSQLRSTLNKLKALGFTSIAGVLTKKRNQVLIANKFITTTGNLSEATSTVFNPKDVNSESYTSEDRIMVTLVRGVDVTTLEAEPNLEQIQKAVDAGASFVTSSASRIITEAKGSKNTAKIGGDLALMEYLASEGYVPRIHMNSLIWSKPVLAISTATEIMASLQTLAQQEKDLYTASTYLTDNYEYNDKDFSDFEVTQLTKEQLEANKETFPLDDPRTKLIQDQLDHLASTEIKGGDALSPRVLKLVQGLKDQELTDKYEIKEKESPESPLTNALRAEYTKRFGGDTSKKLPIPNLEKGTDFDDLNESQLTALEINQKTEDQDFLRDYYDSVVKKTGKQLAPKQTLAVDTAKALRKAKGTKGILAALGKHFASPAEKRILKAITDKINGVTVKGKKFPIGGIDVSFDYVTRSQVAARITSGDISAEIGTRIDNSNEAFLYDLNSKKVYIFAEAAPVNDPETLVNAYMIAVDVAAIQQGLSAEGIESQAGYAGLVAAYKRFYPQRAEPTKPNLARFILDARHDATTKAALQATKAPTSILKAIGGFLRVMFRMSVKDFDEYTVLMGYAAQSIYAGKYLTSSNLGMIAKVERKQFRLEERKVAKQVLLSYLMKGDTYEVAKARMLAPKHPALKVNTEVFKALEAGGVLSFSSPISPEQYRNDESAAIEEEMSFDKTSTMDVFESLSKYRTDNTEHVDHLKKMINLISPAVDKLRLLIRTENIQESYGSEQGGTIDLRVNTGAKANNLEMTAQELYVHETYHAFLRTVKAKQTKVWKKLNSEYLRAVKYLKVEDFLAHIEEPTEADRKAAEKLRDHALFNSTEGGVDYLTYLGEEGKAYNADPVEEFTVLAATNEAVRNALKNLDMRLKGEKNPAEGILHRVMEAFHSLVRIFTDHIYSLQGLQGDERIVRLVEHLMGLQNSQQSTLYKTVRNVDASVDAVGQWVKNKLGETHLVQGIKFASSQYTETVIANVRKMAGDSSYGKNELLLGIANEFTTGRMGLSGLTRLLTKSSYFIERKSQQIVEYVAKEVRETLPELSNEDSSALYSTLLETDAQSLLDQHDLEGVYELLSDPAKRVARVKVLTKELVKEAPNQFARFMKYHAEDLGYHMVTGERLLTDGMYTNASQIANLWGYEGKKPKHDVAKVIPILDEIATLTAIGHSVGKDTVGNTFSDAEYGIKALQTLLLLQREVVDISAKEGFEGNKYNMRKGYVREKVSSEVDIVTGTKEDHARLTALGYTRSQPIAQDPSAKQVGQRHYYTKQGGQQKFLTGVLSLAASTAKGTDIFQPSDSTDEMGVLKLAHDFKYMQKVKQAEMRKTMGSRAKLPAVKPADRGAIAQPLFDSEGTITGYRMILPHKVKDEMLHRETDIQKAIGHTLGGISRKKHSVTINRELMDYIHTTYLEEFKEHPNEFETISALNQSDRYFLIPEDARAYAKTLFGSDQIIVRREQMDIAFGYRKFSVAELKYDSHPAATASREILRMTNNLATLMFNNRVGITLEAYTQAFVATAKDVIVIKSGGVTAANIMSNILLLWWSGVPLTQAILDHGVAYKATFEYNRDHQEIFRVTRRMSDPNVTDAEFQKLGAERAKLRQDLYNNPVRELMEAGLYQTIVDDVETSENVSEARNKLDDLVEPLARRTPSAVKTVAKTFLMTHDTKVYQVLRDTAQISDFAARYSLHKHNMKQGMEFDKSIRDVKTTFVEYDVPQPKWLQYSNDMGLMGFTKWTFRMQQVFIKRFGEKAARGLMLTLLQNMFSFIANPVGGVITGFDAIAQKMGINWLGAMDKGLVTQMLVK